MSTRFGYACLNMTLQKQKPRITCNRGMIKRTFKAKGIPYASQLALQNVKDLLTILKWNSLHNIKVFRITSCLFPWASEYQLEQLPEFDLINRYLKMCGKFARKDGQRLSFHPGPFNIMASEKNHVVANAYIDLNLHGKIFDLMGMERNHWSKINIHIGGSYGDREKALDRFCKNFEGLDESARARLTIENDDKKNLYSTKMLYDSIYTRLNIPIVFDSHHFQCGPQDTDYETAFLMAVDSWPAGIRPQCHHSNSRKKYEDEKVRENAHSDWYYEPFNDCGFSVDVTLECKAKEKALIKYRKDFITEINSNAA